MSKAKNSPYATVPFLLDGTVGFTQRYKLPMDAVIITAAEAMKFMREKTYE